MNKEEVWHTAQYLKEDGTMLVFPKYEVSNLGRVRSLNYHREKRVKMLAPSEDAHSYYHVILRKDNKMFNCRVHRLVASTFLEIPKDPELWKCINHKDETPHNNNVENLEFCTSEHNNTYGSRLEKVSKSQINRKDQSKPVLQIDPKTLDIINEFPSANEASRYLGYNRRAVPIAIWSNHECGGYIWKYK